MPNETCEYFTISINIDSLIESLTKKIGNQTNVDRPNIDTIGEISNLVHRPIKPNEYEVFFYQQHRWRMSS